MLWIDLPDGSLLDLDSTIGRVYVEEVDLVGGTKMWCVTTLVPLSHGHGQAPIELWGPYYDLGTTTTKPVLEKCVLFTGTEKECKRYRHVLHHHLVSNNYGMLNAAIVAHTDAQLEQEAEPV